VALLLAWVLPVIPVAGWVVAQSLTSRTGAASEFSGALVHTLAASTFAVILFTSALINAIIVTRRYRDRPLSYRASRYPLWQGIVIAFSLGWLLCLVIGNAAQTVELVIGCAIAVASIVACVLASRRDREWSARRESGSNAHAPSARRRGRARS
jgi:uncharacterized membrane protein YhaH (DUF805 family)